ncbi:O-antigen ligase family protein [Rubrobacter aplysinae]|uniref:O-antigen ligase family protein n=1 Tax=Rubrobacter aplysinae TaxID=909625 RepID=UPI00064C2415|nr:O-antigen ligase family protein [Rubrobacter aplysinae]
MILAVAGGAGFVYAPLLALLVTGTVFALGLWLMVRDSRMKTEGDWTVGLTGGALQGFASHVWVGRLVGAYLLLFWVIMVIPMLEVAEREVGDQAVQSAASGSLQNQVMVASFGMLGMLFLPAAMMKFEGAFRWALGLWVVYLGWGYSTLFWTTYEPLSTRGLVAFALVSLGSLGFGAGFYGARPDGARLLLKHIFLAGMLSALVIILPLPLHLGTYNPLDPSQRLIVAGDFTKYISRPVLSAVLVLVMGAVMGLTRWRPRDWLWILFLVAPILILKTRGPMLWAMLAFGLVYLLYRARAHERAFQAGLLLLVAFATYISYSRGALDLLIPFLARGDVEQTLTLTGRTDLWAALIPEFLERPFLGHGFAAFWNPVNLQIMEGAAGFPVVSAHNGFLEEFLSTGVIGFLLFMAFWIYVMLLATNRGRRGEPLGWMLLLFMVFYLFLNVSTSLMQNYMEIPFIIVFALLGLMASRSAASPPAEPGDEEAGPETPEDPSREPASRHPAVR